MICCLHGSPTTSYTSRPGIRLPHSMITKLRKRGIGPVSVDELRGALKNDFKELENDPGFRHLLDLARLGVPLCVYDDGTSAELNEFNERPFQDPFSLALDIDLKGEIPGEYEPYVREFLKDVFSFSYDRLVKHLSFHNSYALEVGRITEGNLASLSPDVVAKSESISDLLYAICAIEIEWDVVNATFNRRGVSVDSRFLEFALAIAKKVDAVDGIDESSLDSVVSAVEKALGMEPYGSVHMRFNAVCKMYEYSR